MVSENTNHDRATRPPLPQKFIDDFKRERCLKAIADLVHEVGSHAVRTEMVAQRAKIARATFYGLFRSRDEAFREACEHASGLLLEAIREAAATAGSWEERLEAVIGALLDTAAENPHLAELCLVHPGAFGNGQRSPYDGALAETLTSVLQDIVPERGEGRTLRFSELAACSLISIVSQRLIEGKGETLGELRGELTMIVSLPF